MFGNIIDNNGNVLITNTNKRIVGRTELVLKPLVSIITIKMLFEFVRYIYFGNLLTNDNKRIITNSNNKIVGKTELQYKTLSTTSIIRFMFNFVQAFYFRYLVTEQGKRLISNTNNSLTGKFVIIDIIKDRLLNTNQIIKNYTNTILNKYYYNITNLNFRFIINNVLTRYRLLNTQSIIRVTKNTILSTYKHLINRITITYKFNSIYDRYVITERQQRAVAALLQIFEIKNKIIITDTSGKDNSSDFIQKHRSGIKLKDCKTVFKYRFPHDRYLIIGNKDEIQIWNISNSIDYITFSDRNIDVDTFGTIRQSVVFTPVSKELLDKELLNLLENEMKNGK